VELADDGLPELLEDVRRDRRGTAALLQVRRPVPGKLKWHNSPNRG